MDEVVAPLLHNNDPLNEPAESTVLAQLLHCYAGARELN
jgi:hypothetical protein